MVAAKLLCMSCAPVRRSKNSSTLLPSDWIGQKPPTVTQERSMEIYEVKLVLEGRSRRVININQEGKSIRLKETTQLTRPKASL